MTEPSEDGARAQQRPGEIAVMSHEERAKRLDALWQRLMDPDGFDRKALANMKEATV
jgi:hypothetical protein